MDPIEKLNTAREKLAIHLAEDEGYVMNKTLPRHHTLARKIEDLIEAKLLQPIPVDIRLGRGL